MTFKQIKNEGLAYSYEVKVPAKAISGKIDERLAEIGKTVKIAGFRKGKVPVSVLQKRYGANAQSETLEKLINTETNALLEKEALRPATRPNVDIKSYDEGKPLTFTVDFDVLPKIEFMDFKTLETTTYHVAVNDEKIQETLENLSKTHGTTEPLKRARKSRAGDVATIDFKGSVDGEFLPEMAGEDYPLELGSNSFIPGFEKQIIGAKPGEDVTVTVTFPENYGAEKIAGKEAIFEVHVKSLQVREPAEINDEFAQKFGKENLTDLQKQIKDDLENQFRSMARPLIKRNLLDALDKKHTFDLPASLVDSEFDAIWKQVQAEKDAGNLDQKEAKKSEKTLKSDYRKIAERRVRLGLLLAEVSEKNSLEVTQEELNQAVMSEAMRYQGQEQQVFEYFSKNPQAINSLRAPLIEDKVVDYILEVAKTERKTVTEDALKDLLKDLETAL